MEGIFKRTHDGTAIRIALSKGTPFPDALFQYKEGGFILSRSEDSFGVVSKVNYPILRSLERLCTLIDISEQ